MVRKLKSIREVEPFGIYDITVDVDHCFELENGVIAHNSMFPKDIVSGGCVVAGTEITLPDGTTKVIENFIVGDEVATLQGAKSVTHTWNPDTLDEGEPNCFEIEFEDGTTVVVSEQHRFLLQETTDSSPHWVEAAMLKVDDDCKQRKENENSKN